MEIATVAVLPRNDGCFIFDFWWNLSLKKLMAKGQEPLIQLYKLPSVAYRFEVAQELLF